MLHIKTVVPEFTDHRGAISRIMDIDPKIKVALFISSKQGSIRANHYHKHDIHYTYLLTGSFEYIEYGLESGAKAEKVLIGPGDLVETPANQVHSMKFLEDSTMIVLSTEPRDQSSYEKDTVRVKLLKQFSE